MRNWSSSSATSKRRPLPTTKRRRREPAKPSRPTWEKGGLVLIDRRDCRNPRNTGADGTDKKGILRTDTVLYWPEFDFDFRLDIQRLLPHIAAIHAYQEAGSNRVRPPQWREQPTLTSAVSCKDSEDTPGDLSQEQRPRRDSIDQRKQQLLMRNGGMTQAWVRARFAQAAPCSPWPTFSPCIVWSRTNLVSETTMEVD